MNAARLYAPHKGAFEHKRQVRQTGFKALRPPPEQPLDGGQHNGFTETWSDVSTVNNKIRYFFISLQIVSLYYYCFCCKDTKKYLIFFYSLFISHFSLFQHIHLVTCHSVS